MPAAIRALIDCHSVASLQIVIIVTLVIVSCQAGNRYNLVTMFTKGVGRVKEKKTAVMTIRMTEATKQAIEQAAARHDWTPSKMAEKILTAWAHEQSTETLPTSQDREINVGFYRNEIETVNIK